MHGLEGDDDQESHDAADRADPGALDGADVTREPVLRVSRRLSVPLREITWRATTSGGPGGQHANRSLSRVEVRFDVETSNALGPRQRATLFQRLGPVVVAQSGDERSQARNRQLALDRLASRLAEALRTRPPRRPTAPSQGARARRLEDKRRRSATKQRRRPPGPED
ncbi:MAG: alternative ribosome rescue aminoacyl-tRNA hydrolase ArfB [Acidimicrobiales bacterium]